MSSRSLMISCIIMTGFVLTFVSAQEMPTPLKNSELESVHNTNHIPGPQYEKIRPLKVTSIDTGKKYDVIVIGSGISGLETAKHLQSKNMNVIVLEARDRIGGRIWTDNTSGASLDLGGSWIHGLGNMSKIGGANPIYLMTNKYNIATSPTNQTMVSLYDSHGYNYTTNKKYNYTEYNNFNSTFNAFLSTTKSEPGKSIQDIVTDFKKWATKNNITINEKMLDYYLYWNYLLDNVSSNPSNLSSAILFNNTAESYFYGDDSPNESVFQNGYDQIANMLADGLDIKHAVVNKIEYGNNGVSVFTDSGTFNANYAVSTLPLGVLKSGKVIFDPPLNETDPNKADAIKNLNMGTLDKVYFIYNPTIAKTLPFWKYDNKTDWINRMPDNDTDTGWIMFFNISKYDGKPILMGFNSGQYAQNLENENNQTIIQSGVDVLGNMYNTKIPLPDKYVITRWANDPFSGGSYTSVGPNANETSFDYLEKPIENKLFFAGEATHRLYFGTVHGAYISGYRAAEKILALNNNEDSPYKQLANGISETDIICHNGLVLRNQTAYNLPACVNPNNDMVNSRFTVLESP